MKVNKITMAVLTTSCLITPLSATAEEATAVPHNFTAGQPARAYQVNENFDSVNKKTNENKSSVVQLEQSIEQLKEDKNKHQTSISSIEESLEKIKIGQKLIRDDIEVDCTEDPAALSNAYWQVKDNSLVAFTISGACYGDIRTNPENGDYYQAHHQTLMIDGSDLGGSLIPNPQSNNTGMWGGFNGGLYLTNLTVDLGTGGGFGFSRNSQGELSNLTIIGDGGQRAITVQASAQVYVAGVSISKVHQGVLIRDAGVVRVYNGHDGIFGLEISDSNLGVAIQSSGSLLQWGPINIDVIEQAININNGHWDTNWTDTFSIKGQNIIVEDNGTFKSLNATIDVESVEVNNASFTLNHESTIDITTLSCAGLSKVNIDGVQDLLNEVPNANCLDNNGFSRLIQLLK